MAPNRNPTGFHPHFSPWLADHEQLSRTLVRHHDIIRDFLACLQSIEKGSPANHMLLVGPRGIGKTHVLCLVGHYVSGRLQIPADWSSPSASWVCILFTEEEYAGQNSLANFLLAVFAKLREALPLERFWDLPAHIHDESDQSVIDCCFERLERFHAERGRKVLLLIDNLQKILEQWSGEDHQRLRSFLSRNNLLVIFGSAPSVFREVMDQKAAFHDFFEIRIFTELDNEQALELLSRRFEEDGRQHEFDVRRDELSRKMPAMEILTGGNPRLVLFLYQIATRSAFLDIEIALRSLLEELREYFVRRFDELPPQARKVLDTIAQMPGPATPTEISQAARLPVPTVNAQLQRLKKGHYVRPIKLQRQKSTCYDITERLFRIWRQTATVAGRQRFRFLADFLKLYFTPDEVHALYAHHLEHLQVAAETSREEVLRHIEELFYFQAAGDAEVRYGAFSSRVESLLKLGELQWAEEETQYFAAESVRNEDKLGTTAAVQQQAKIHVQSDRYKEAVDDIEKLIEVGAYPDALSTAERIVAAEPNNARAWEQLGVSAYNLGNYERALEAFRTTAKVGQPTADLWTNQASALRALGQQEEAIACSEQAVSLDPNNARAWEQLGVSAYNLGNYERALEAFRTTAKVGQPTAALWTYQGFAIRALGRQEDALACSEQAVSLDPNNARAWGVLGMLADGLGSHARALEAFRTATKVGQPTAALWTYQGFALRALGRQEEALACYEQAVSLDPNDARVWQVLGLSAFILGNYERALEAFCTAAKVGQRTADLWTYQASALRVLGRHEEALACSEHAVALDPNNATAWEELGFTACTLGNYERGLETFRIATKVGQQTTDLLRYQAIAHRALGRQEEALACSEQAVSLDPNDALAWEQLGLSASALGSHERALEAFRTAAKVGKASGELLKWQANALRQLGRTKEGLDVLEEALSLETTNADLWCSKAWTLSEMDRIEDALQCMDRARHFGATPRKYHHDRGDMLLLAGRYQEALVELEAGLKVAPDDWDLHVDRLIALACLQQLGPSMEALPSALAQVNIPRAGVTSVCEFLHDMALHGLRRGETQIGRGLFAATLEMKDRAASEWFGKQVGRFLRQVLDVQPQMFSAFVTIVHERVEDENVLKLLDPFLQANDLLRTKNVAILERLFVEVRELVLDIVRRVDPELYQQVERLT